MVRKYFPNELELARFSRLVLTTHRVIKEGSSTILVHHISGTRIEHRNHPVLVLVAVVAFVAGVVLDQHTPTDTSTAGVILAAILVVAFFAMRETFIEVYGDGKPLSCIVGGSKAKQDEARKFLDAVDRVACISCRGPEALQVLSAQTDPQTLAPPNSR